MRTFALIAIQGKMLSFAEPMNILFELPIPADGVRSASDQTEAVFLSLVTRLHCYTCLVSVCLARVFFFNVDTALRFKSSNM